MQRYFSNNMKNNYLILSDEDIYHITKVMRLKEQDKIEVVYEKKLYICELVMLSNQLNFKIIKEIDESFNKKIDVTLIVPLIQEQKMDYILQKATELGVSRIIPYLAKRSVIKLDEKRLIKRLDRWRRICKEASEQSKRLDIPEVDNLHTIDQLKNMSGVKILCSTKSEIDSIRNYLKKNDKCAKISVVIGPEGGFDSKEEETLIKYGFNQVSLGDLILRVETVPVVILSILNYEIME